MINDLVGNFCGYIFKNIKFRLAFTGFTVIMLFTVVVATFTFKSTTLSVLYILHYSLI